MGDYINLSENIKTHDDFIDAMKSCLYAAEKHGIVFGQIIEDRDSLIDTARKLLPEYSVTESVNIDCFMIKQSVIDMFGTPEPGCPAEELTKYCEKINQYGYSAIVAHKALYSQLGVRSEELGVLCEEDNPALRFLTLLDETYYPKKRILFECTNLPPTHCGTTEAMLYAYEAFCKLFSDKYDVFMLTNHEAAQYHSLEEKYNNILYPDTITGAFHLGYVPVQMHQYESQLLLNRHCLKIVQQVLDIIMVRSYKQHDLAARANIDLGVWLSDGITFISNFSHDDFMAYYMSLPVKSKPAMTRVIYVAKEVTDTVNDGYKLPFEEYFLITGNTFKHKAINETLDVLSDTSYNYIVIGARKTGKIKDNIYAYHSGQLDDGFVNCLYAKCKAVIFPSLYEGFGLPIVMGLNYGKQVIVYDNELNRELSELYPECKENFLFFNTFKQLSEIISNCQLSIVNCQLVNDSWDRVAQELEEFFVEVLTAPVDIRWLCERDWVYGQIEERAAFNKVDDYKLFSFLKFALKENIKHRHKKMFRFLKKLKG